MDREGNITNALEDYKTGRFKSVCAAAEFYKVSPATLARRVNGLTSVQQANVPNQVYTPAEEQAIVFWIQ